MKSLLSDICKLQDSYPGLTVAIVLTTEDAREVCTELRIDEGLRDWRIRGVPVLVESVWRSYVLKDSDGWGPQFHIL